VGDVNFCLFAKQNPRHNNDALSLVDDSPTLDLIQQVRQSDERIESGSISSLLLSLSMRLKE
jgi:hypothetical protein